MSENPYKKQCPVGITAPAEMLESWAGYTRAEALAELTHALDSANPGNHETLQWLACGIERRLADVGA